jgi:hypothetical protein
VFEEATLRRASHPWLLLEDAHAGVYEVLSGSSTRTSYQATM